MAGPQSFNKILLTTSNNEEYNILLQEISGQLYIGDNLVLTSANNAEALTSESQSDGTSKILLSDLPTTDPQLDGQIWNESGVLKVSSGTSSNESSSFNTYSVNLDGTNDYVAVGASSDFSFGTSDFSFSVWFNPGVVSGYRAVIDFRQSNGNLLPSLYYSPNGGYKLYVWTGSSQVANYNTTLTAGQWYHVVYTRSGTAGTIYLNGTSVATGTDSSNYSMNGQPHIGGKAPGVSASYHSGPIDEVSVFNYALSASNVSDIYNSGVPTNISSLNPLGWWRMGDNDSGTGSTVTDQGSGGNNGTLTNGATFSTAVPS